MYGFKVILFWLAFIFFPPFTVCVVLVFAWKKFKEIASRFGIE